jgi:hypothetical protein
MHPLSLSWRFENTTPMKGNTLPSPLSLHPDGRAAELDLRVFLFGPNLLKHASIHDGHVSIDSNLAERCCHSSSCIRKPQRVRPNAGLQLRRAISIQADGKRLLEKHAIAPSAARLCYAAPYRQRVSSKAIAREKNELKMNHTDLFNLAYLIC